MAEFVPLMTILVFVAYLAALFFNWQAGIPPSSPMSLGIFRNSIGNLSNQYSTPVVPAGYTFAIWGLIYSWFALWVVYVFSTFCRSNPRGPIYLNPKVTTAGFLFVVFLNLTFNVSWLFAWDRQTFVLSLIFLALIANSLYLALALHTTRVYEYIPGLKEYGNFEFWANQTFIHNGLALYATWTTVATKVNLSVTMIYRFGVDEVTTTYVCLFYLAFQLITYFIMDCFVYDRYLRYVLIVYPAVMWSLGGLLVANISKPDSPQAVIGSALFALAFVFFLVKTVLVLSRDPVNPVGEMKEKSMKVDVISKGAYEPVVMKV